MSENVTKELLFQTLKAIESQVVAIGDDVKELKLGLDAVEARFAQISVASGTPSFGDQLDAKLDGFKLDILKWMAIQTIVIVGALVLSWRGH